MATTATLYHTMWMKVNTIMPKKQEEFYFYTSRICVRDLCFCVSLALPFNAIPNNKLYLAFTFMPLEINFFCNIKRALKCVKTVTSPSAVKHIHKIFMWRSIEIMLGISKGGNYVTYTFMGRPTNWCCSEGIKIRLTETRPLN